LIQSQMSKDTSLIPSMICILESVYLNGKMKLWLVAVATAMGKNKKIENCMCMFVCLQCLFLHQDLMEISSLKFNNKLESISLIWTQSPNNYCFKYKCQLDIN